MAAKIEIDIVYDEELDTCRVAWTSRDSGDITPMEKNKLNKLKFAIINQFYPDISNGQSH